MILAMLVAAMAPAQAACPEAIELDVVLSRTTAIEEAIAGDRTLNARDEARRLRDEVRCLDAPLPDVRTAAELARAIGSGYVAAGDMALGKPWLRTALDLEADYVWTLADDHPVMEVWRALSRDPDSEPVLFSDEGFVGPAWLDGASITEASARPDRPHIFQVGEAPTETLIIFGNRFPTEALGRPSKASRRRPRPSVTESRRAEQPLVVDRLRPPEKTPLLVGGAALIVMAGGMYALAAQRRQRFDDPEVATTLEELTSLRNQVNGLVIASAATLAIGAGGATWGSLVDARGSATLRVRF